MPEVFVALVSALLGGEDGLASLCCRDCCCCPCCCCCSPLAFLKLVSTCQRALSISVSRSGNSRAWASCLLLVGWRMTRSSSTLSETWGSGSASEAAGFTSGCGGAGRASFWYIWSRIGEGAGLISLFSRRNWMCFPPDRARQCDQAR